MSKNFQISIESQFNKNTFSPRSLPLIISYYSYYTQSKYQIIRALNRTNSPHFTPPPPPRLTRKLARRSTLAPMHDELTEATEALSSSSAPYGEKKRIGQSARVESTLCATREEGEREERGGGGGGDRRETAKEGTGLWRAIARSLSLSLSSRLYPSSPWNGSPFSLRMDREGRGEGERKKMRKSSGGPSAAVIGLIYGTNN